MTIDQINYALAVEKYGSINRAARMLFISQPHLSKSIHSIETELKYPVFDRLPHGIVPTQKGQLFLDHCRIILREYRKATLLSSENTYRSFHLAAGSIYFFMQAFAKLCSCYQNNHVLDLQISHKNADDIIESVSHGGSDLGILLIGDEFFEEHASHAQRQGLKTQRIHHLDTVISLRKGHPLLKKKPLELTRLYEYPFVDYAKRDVSSTLRKETSRFINPDKIILIDERETRHMIVSKTDAFSIGCSLSEDILRQYNLVSLPVPVQGFQIVALYRQQSGLSEEGELYLKILSEILEGKADEASEQR